MDGRECLDILNKVIPLPSGYYYGVDVYDNLKITLFQEDGTMSNKMGQAIETFVIDNYSTRELLEFYDELEDYINKCDF